MDKYYIANLDKGIIREHVSYKNRYGMMISGDLYSSESIQGTKNNPAIIVGAPYGGVKEQGPCVYANELAKKGFVVLTFDQSFMGESSGEPRHVSSPDIFSENFSAGVDYLGCHKLVGRERIGAIGICGSGGFALNAAQGDTRIKAIATASMYDMSKAVRLGVSESELLKMKDSLSRQRYVDFENDKPEFIPMFQETPLDSLPSGIDEVAAEWLRFYAVKRGHHPHARGGFTTTSALALLNTQLLAHIKEISPRPILFIVGDHAHSKFFSEDAYEDALEPKELYVVNDAEHIDLYDRVDRIPFDKLGSFFNQYL